VRTEIIIKLARILLIAGILFGLPSLWETLSFSWDPSFQAPALRFGATHTNYHVFREFTLTLGALSTMVWVMFQPPASRSRPLWTTMLIAAGFYYVGWWLPWPLLGLHTPNVAAEIVHLAAAASSLTAIFLVRKEFKVGVSYE
jgi:hypothetical protein